MVIDEKILRAGVDARIAGELISRHERETERLSRLRDYYLGRHDILARTRRSDGSPNNRVVCNHAKYIVDMMQSYLLGKPVTYACSEGFDIEAIKNLYLIRDAASLDAELEKEMSIFGSGFELVFADEGSVPKSLRLSPLNTFAVYSDGADERLLLGVHYFKRYDLRGSVSGAGCTVADAKKLYVFESDADSFSNMKLVSERAHYFGDVPFIEYRNNDERQGDFEQLIPLIDAYNLLQSDRVNDKEQFVDAFLFLSGIEIDGEQARKLREERILMGYDGSKAEYLSKVMSESDVEVLCEGIKKDIHRFSMTPDLSDESFGGNLSGVAIKYKLLGFEQRAGNKERSFAAGLRRRFRLYNNLLALKGGMDYVPIHKVDVVFTRNLPVNELEVSEMINNLKGVVSSETLLSRLSFVDDPKEEAELAKRERSENSERSRGEDPTTNIKE